MINSFGHDLTLEKLAYVESKHMTQEYNQIGYVCSCICKTHLEIITDSPETNACWNVNSIVTDSGESTCSISFELILQIRSMCK